MKLDGKNMSVRQDSNKWDTEVESIKVCRDVTLIEIYANKYLNL